jgi:sulfur carrier protein ThiS
LSVRIRLIGILKQYAHGENEITVDSGLTVRNSLFSIGIPPEIIALVLVNEIPVDKEHVLADGDIVQLIAVIGGGS